jgi:hypothetical protein
MGAVSIPVNLDGFGEIGRRNGTTGEAACMIGLEFMDSRLDCPTVPYICPILAGSGWAMTLAMAVIDWTQLTTQAAGALGVAGLVGGGIVGGIVWGIRKYDIVQIERRRLYDQANKDSLSKQIADLQEQNRLANEKSLSNQEAQRESLHQLRNDAATTRLENEDLRQNLTELRGQFMQVSKELRETDKLLHSSNDKLREMASKLQETSDLLQSTSKDRDALRTELEVLRGELGSFRKTQFVQGAKITALEKISSSDSIPALGPQVETVSTPLAPKPPGA